MEKSRSWARQQISRILLDLDFHYHIHKRLPPVPVLSKIKPVHISPSHLKIHFNISSNLGLSLPSGCVVT